MADKSVVLVSYYGHQARLFCPMAEALGGRFRVKHLKVYPLTLERIATSFLRRNGLGPSDVETITRYYRLKKSLRCPEIDTKAWRAHLAGRTADWYRLFCRRFAGHDLLVVWNGFSIPLGSAVAAARSLGMKVVFCENGVLPHTLAMDPRGINCMNSLAGKPVEFYESIKPDTDKVTQLFGTQLCQRPLRRSKCDASSGSDDDRPLPERYALFAMQVHDDSQVLLFSPKFRNMHEAVSHVLERLSAYNELTGDTLQLVVKEHPSDFGRVDYSDLRRSTHGALFVRSRPLSELLPNAQVVVTLNSGVGIEALLHLRPVVTLADAFYNIPGVVHHLGDDGDLAAVLAECVGRPVNRELITRFLYFLRYEYLVPVSRQSSDPVQFGPAVERITDVMYDRLYWAT